MGRRHKPCPFCGGVDLIPSLMYGRFRHVIKCQTCQSYGPTAGSFDEAWRKWDERKSLTPDEARRLIVYQLKAANR